MSFLDEATIKTTPENLPKVRQQAGDDDTIEVMEKKSKKRPDYADVDGDGDRDEPMAKAFKDKEKGDVEEGKVKNFLTGLALFTALMAGKNAVVNSDPGLKKLKAAYEQAEKKDDTAKMKELKDKITKQKIWLEAGEGEPQSVDETKTVELPADTTFTLDLKHLMKKTY